MTALHYLDASTALGLFRRRELSPVELLQAVIDRIGEVNGGVNALTETLFEEALPAARKAATQYARGRDITPLLGLPVAAKEKHGLQGRTLSQGLVMRKDTIAESDHPVIDRIRRAGGIIHARTTTPELSCATVTHSPLWGGVTRNPWNQQFSPPVGHREVQVRRWLQGSRPWLRRPTSLDQPGCRRHSLGPLATRRPTEGFQG